MRIANFALIVFENRVDAGKRLADALRDHHNRKNTLVIALPRGGVVIGFEIAQALNLPLDIVVPRKLGAPGNEEFAIGALTETGERILDHATIASFKIPGSYLKETIQKELNEAKRRRSTYRVNRPPKLDLGGKTVILVDDGIATGLTMRAAVASVKSQTPSKIIVAIPTSPKESLQIIKKKVDEVICLDTPLLFG